MNWVEGYEKFTDKEKLLFSNCVNRLKVQTYLVSKREEDMVYYRFCERHADILNGYLNMTHWEMKLHKEYGVIYLLNSENRSKRNLNLCETLFLFILRSLYDEKQKELRMSREIFVTNRDIHDKYLNLKIRERLPGLEEYGKILKLFSKYALVGVKGFWSHPDSFVTLYPSILIAVSQQSVEMITKWIEEKGNKHGEEGEEDENIEESVFD